MAVLQQDVMRLLGEKQVSESSRRHLQELLQRLEAELSASQREKAAEALEQHSQVGETQVLPSSHTHTHTPGELRQTHSRLSAPARSASHQETF